MIISQHSFYYFDNIFREIYSLYSFLYILYILPSFISFHFGLILNLLGFPAYFLMPSTFSLCPRLIRCALSSFACIPAYSLVSRLIRFALGLYDNSAEGVTRLPKFSTHFTELCKLIKKFSAYTPNLKKGSPVNSETTGDHTPSFIHIAEMYFISN